jgi:hypothetical protein
MISAEVQNLVANLRRKALDGTLTEEETREGIRLLRENRLSAASKPKANPKKSVNLDNLLGELGL